MAIKTNTGKLANGLGYGCNQMDSVETVTVSVMVNCGARDEDYGSDITGLNDGLPKNGIAHFLEHMAFKGTNKRNAAEIAEAVDNVGGYMNAYTSKEKTCYYIKVLKKHQELAFDVISDILHDSTFDKEELERERGVILQELAASEDTPDDVAYDYYFETAYPNQPLGRPILGPAKNIESFSADEFRDFIGKKYSADKMFVSVAGNTDIDTVKNLTEKYFSKFKSFDRPERIKPVYGGGELRKEKDLNQVQYLLGFKAEDYHSNDYYKMKIMSAILGSGMSSRLFQEIREKRGLVYTVSAFGSSFEDNGIWTIYAGTSPDKLEELTKAAINELKRATTDISKTEMQKVVNQFESSLLMSRESTTSMSQSLASNMLIFGRDITPEEIMEKVLSFKIGDIQDYLSGLLSKKELTLTAYGKIDNLPRLDDIKAMIG